MVMVMVMLMVMVMVMVRVMVRVMVMVMSSEIKVDALLIVNQWTKLVFIFQNRFGIISHQTAHNLAEEQLLHNIRSHETSSLLLRCYRFH